MFKYFFQIHSIYIFYFCQNAPLSKVISYNYHTKLKITYFGKCNIFILKTVLFLKESYKVKA